MESVDFTAASTASHLLTSLGVALLAAWTWLEIRALQRRR